MGKSVVSEDIDLFEILKDETWKLHEKSTNKADRDALIVLAKRHLEMFSFEKHLNKVFVGKVPTSKYQGPKVNKTKRYLNLVISDTHYGSELDPEETGRSYSRMEEARRTAEICRQVANYKRDHRSETSLIVHIIGDLIHGRLHDPSEGEPLAKQKAITIWLLVQALNFLSTEFKEVQVYCATGNHGRNKARHNDRAVAQKWDSCETDIYYAIKIALAGNPRVKVQIPKSPYYEYTVFDKKGFATHGDTVLKPGNPGKSINIGSIRNQINEINSAQIVKGQKPIDLFMVGHVHTASLSHLANGTVFLSNSALIPPDAYANSIGIFETNCGQWIWESVPGHIMGDSRFIQVGEATDKDKTLDGIIKPWSGF